MINSSLSQGKTATCYARTYVSKALIGLGFLPVMVVVVYIGLSRGGATYLDIPYLIYSGQLVWWKQAIGWLCWVIWLLRYCPPSWKALRHNMCAIARDGDELVLSGAIRLPISDVLSIKPVSNITKKGIVIQTSDGQSYYVCSIPTDLNNPRILAERIRADCNLAGGIPGTLRN